jgi:hypothetical protein
VETLELRRLYAECGIELGRILAEPKVLKLLARQFAARMNNSKTYGEQLLVEAIKKLAYYDLARIDEPELA